MLDKMMQKIIEKKKRAGDVLDENEQTAKHSVLEDLLGHLDGMDGEKVKGMKKVTIASDSKEGLQHGLAKAADMVEKGPMTELNREPEEGDVADHAHEDMDSEEQEESPEHEAGESEEEESAEHEESPEELQAKIEELKAKLDKHRFK